MVARVFGVPDSQRFEPSSGENMGAKKQRSDDKTTSDETQKLKHRVIPEDNGLALPVITVVVSCQ